MKQLLKSKFIVVFFCLLVILLGYQVIRCKYPGLYLDAVNPDYMAVQILFPKENSNWMVPYSFIPLLGQLYHGTVTLFFQIMGILLTGNVSVLLLRSINAFYVLSICIILYAIMSESNIEKWVRGATVLLIALSPQVFSFIRTQYYIKLPGTFFLLLSYYLLQRSCKPGKAFKDLIWSGVLAGLAFYSYFIYIFFAPAICLVLFLRLRKTGNIHWISFWGVGFWAGSVPYIIGYFDLIITTLMEKTLSQIQRKYIIFFFALVLILVVFFLIIRCYNFYHNKISLKRLYLSIFSIVSIGIIMCLIWGSSIISVLLPKLGGLNIGGERAGIIRRIQLILSYYKGILNNSIEENLMLQRQISVCGNINIIIALLIAILFVIRGIRKKQWNREIMEITFLIVSYFIFSFAFVSRMGGQHFVPLYFLTMLFIALNIGHLIKVYNKKPNRIRVFISLLYLIVLFITIGNTNLLSINLKKSQGEGLFTWQINTVAENALENLKKGEKELYVFPEWGMMSGFNYLTMNSVEYITSVDENKIKEYRDRGYTIRIFYFQKNNEEVLKNQLQKVGLFDITEQVYYTGSGNEVIYELFTQTSHLNSKR